MIHTFQMLYGILNTFLFESMKDQNPTFTFFLIEI